MKCLSFLLMMICYTQSYGQSWRPEFRIPLTAEWLALQNSQSLNTFLGRNVSYHSMAVCDVEMSVFTFRVTSEGRVDSIDVYGNLNKDAANKIVKNIRMTEGKWEIPAHTNASDKCWFVYPFFQFGNYNPCPIEKKKSFSQVLELYYIYENLADTVDKWGRVIITPNPFAKLAEK